MFCANLPIDEEKNACYYVNVPRKRLRNLVYTKYKAEMREIVETEEKKITIADIAEHLGVSKTTVSRAISGKGRVSEETKLRVQSYIDHMDYKPNVIAKGLAQSKTYNIAVLLPRDCEMQELPFFQNCMCGICDAAAKRDYDVLTVYAAENELAGVERIVSNHKVDGVILSRTLVEDKAADYLKKRKIPVVAIGSAEDKTLLQVDHDHRSACRELTAHQFSRGIRKIGLIGGKETHVVTRNRYKGFVDAFRTEGLPVDMDRVFFGAVNQKEIAQAVEVLLERDTECIVCMDDMICRHVLCTLQEKKNTEAIKVVSFYGGIAGTYPEKQVETVEFDAKKLGFVTANTILDVIEGKQTAEKQLLPYQLHMLTQTDKCP